MMTTLLITTEIPKIGCLLRELLEDPDGLIDVTTDHLLLLRELLDQLMCEPDGQWDDLNMSTERLLLDLEADLLEVVEKYLDSYEILAIVPCDAKGLVAIVLVQSPSKR